MKGVLFVLLPLVVYATGGKHRTNYTRVDLAEAAQELQGNKGLTIRGMSRDKHIPFSTLQVQYHLGLHKFTLSSYSSNKCNAFWLRSVILLF